MTDAWPRAQSMKHLLPGFTTFGMSCHVALVAQAAPKLHDRLFGRILEGAQRDLARLVKKGLGFGHAGSVCRFKSLAYSYFPRSHTKNFALLGTGK